MNSDFIRVMLVEDSPGDARLLREMLTEVSSTQFDLTQAKNLEEAMSLLGKAAFDVVLLDLSLPDSQDLGTFTATHAYVPGMPIVVLTGLDDEQLAIEAVREGAQDYLVKGKVDGQLLARAIRYAIERKRAQERLRRHAEHLEERVRERTAQAEAQYARLEEILRSTSDGIVVTDLDGQIVQANPVAHTWLTQTLSPENAERVREAVSDLAKRAPERPEVKLQLEELDLKLSAGPVEVMEGAAVVAMHDLSSLKALEKLKSHLVTNISHELRTPITTIRLYTALMRRTPREKWDEYLSVLEQEIEWQIRLVEGILQIAQIDAGRLLVAPQPTPLNGLAEQTVARHQAIAREKDLILERVTDGPSLVALADPNHICQVLNNLLANAIQYTDQGGRVTVSTAERTRHGRTWATMTVTDTGMGIPEEELPHVFERFYRGEITRSLQISGVGLGLSVAKEIVDRHEGQITVESQVDQGSAFTIWLPIADR